MSKFDEFWAVLPRKVGKAITRSKFAKITGSGLHSTGDGEKLFLRETEDNLIKAGKAWRVQTWDDDTEKMFIPHPRTWLSQGRFEDFDEDERDSMAERYDVVLVKVADRKLRVIK